MNASDYDSEDLAEVTKTMGKWKLGGEANAIRNDDDVEGHGLGLKNDAAAAAADAAADDVEGHSAFRNIDDQGAETDESSDKPGVRVRVRVRNDEADVEGHGKLRNDDEDTEGHGGRYARNDDDDVEGHTRGAR
jgi:hypothetical protein